jgi:hypothetical protein
VVGFPRPLARRIVGGIAGLVAPASIGGVVLAAPAYAVTGGSPATDWNSQITVKIRVGDLRDCSGALVARSRVITAKSCLANGSQPVVVGPWEEYTVIDLAQDDFGLLARANGRYVTAETPGVSADRQPHRDRRLGNPHLQLADRAAG